MVPRGRVVACCSCICRCKCRSPGRRHAHRRVPPGEAVSAGCRAGAPLASRYPAPDVATGAGRRHPFPHQHCRTHPPRSDTSPSCFGPAAPAASARSWSGCGRGGTAAPRAGTASRGGSAAGAGRASARRWPHAPSGKDLTASRSCRRTPGVGPLPAPAPATRPRPRVLFVFVRAPRSNPSTHEETGHVHEEVDGVYW